MIAGKVCTDRVIADIYYLADSSNSIYPVGWGRELAFIANTARDFKLGPDDTQVAFGIFSTRFLHYINLGQYTDHDQFAADVLDTPQLQELTYTFNALDTINREGYLTDPKQGARSIAVKVLIIITDGNSDDTTRTIAAAAALKTQNIIIVAIAVGFNNLDELRAAASRPEFVFSVKNFAALESIRQQLTQTVCEVAPEPTTVPPPPPTTTEAIDFCDSSHNPCQYNCTHTPQGPVCSCPPPLIPTPSDPTQCKEISCEDLIKADIYYLADSSNSIYPVGWGRELDFIVNTAKAYKLGPSYVQVAFGIFSTRFLHYIDLNKYTNHADFAADVRDTPQLQELTYTYDALNAINREGYLTSTIHGSRPDVPKVLVIITDGQSQNITKTLEAAKALREQNITILTIGVGFTNQVELQGMASSPDTVFGVKNFGALGSIKNLITQRICDAPIIPDPPCSNRGELDLVVLVDASSSIGREIFDRNFEFVGSIVRGFTLGETSTKLALETFSTSPHPVFNLTASTDVIYQTLLNVSYLNGSSNAHLALLSAKDLLSPAFGGRPEARKAVVLITNRISSDPSAAYRVANELKSQGVNIFTMGIDATADNLELTGLASRVPYNFPVPNYNSLVLFASTVAQVICEAPPPPKPVDPCPPQVVDLFTIVDSSGSIGIENYKYNFQLISRILSAHTIAENATKVALITFGTSVKPRFSLSGDKNFIDEQLKNVPYQDSTTNTHLALRYIINGGYNDPSKGARPTARKVIFLITDGKSTIPDQTLEAAKEVKDQGFNVAVIGVGNSVDEDELDAVASRKEFVLLPKNYAELENFASLASEIVCKNKI